MTVTCITGWEVVLAGASLMKPIWDTVRPNNDMKTASGTAVQKSSRRVLPWNCEGSSSSCLRRNLNMLYRSITVVKTPSTNEAPSTQLKTNCMLSATGPPGREGDVATIVVAG